MKYRSLLIAGGAGFIGTNIGELALKKGYKVIIFDNFVRLGVEENAVYLEKLGAKIVRGDVRSIDDLNRLPKINAIINLAANPGIPWSMKWPFYDFSINTLGALNLLELARKLGNTPVLFASTNKIYSEEINEIPMVERKTRYIWKDKKFKGINEEFPMDSAGKYPHSPYGCSKAAADLYHQEYFHIYGVPTVVNRMSCLTGDTTIATVAGNITIRDLISKDNYPLAYTYDEENNLVISKINKIWKRGMKDIYVLKTENSVVKVTSDHLFGVIKDGKLVYKKLIDLGKGETVLFFPFSKPNKASSKLKKIKFNLGDVARFYNGKKTSTKFYRTKIVDSLNKIFSDTQNYSTLARLLGYLFGDGNLSVSYDKKNNKNVFNLSFYGDKVTLDHIKQELERLGIKEIIHEKKYSESKLSNKHRIKGYSERLRSGSSFVAILFYLLGYPFGDKTVYEGGIPWFVKENDPLTKEFLKGFFDAELANLIYSPSKKCWNGLSLVVTKRESIENKFLEEIAVYLKKKGITYSPIRKKSGFLTKKGTTYQYVLNIHKNRNNLKRFANNFGFSLNTKRLKNLLLAISEAEKVVEISNSGIKEKVYDLEIDKTHNFFANNLNVHNCIYGLHQKGVEDQGWLWWFVEAKKKNLPLNIYGNGKQVRDALFGTDLAELYLEELENIDKHKGRVYNVGGGSENTVSLLEVIDYLNKKGGKKLKLKFYPWRQADHRIYISDITKIISRSNWKPKTSAWQGIDKMWEAPACAGRMK